MINVTLIKQAIFDKLSNDNTLVTLLGGIKIFHQHPARTVAYPRVVYEIITNEDNIYNEDTESGDVTVTFFRITVFSSSGGSKESDDIENRIKYLLHGQSTLDNNSLACYSCYREFLEQRYDTDAKVWTTFARYRAVTAPKGAITMSKGIQAKASIA
jgi:hypothetical protein